MSEFVLPDDMLREVAKWLSSCYLKRFVATCRAVYRACQAILDERRQSALKTLHELDYTISTEAMQIKLFFEAAEYNHVDALNALLDLGVDPNVCTNGKTALMLAAYNGNDAIVRILIAAGADVNVADTSRVHTALMSAAMNDSNGIVTTLIAAGADVNAADWAGHTVLMYAVFKGCNQNVQTLIAAGAKVDAIDHCRRTALIWSAVYGRSEVTRTLIGAGADVNPIDVFDQTALMWATGTRHHKVVDILVAAGAVV